MLAGLRLLTSYGSLQGILPNDGHLKNVSFAKSLEEPELFFIEELELKIWLFNFWLLTNIIQIIMKLPLTPFLLNIFQNSSRSTREAAPRSQRALLDGAEALPNEPKLSGLY